LVEKRSLNASAPFDELLAIGRGCEVVGGVVCLEPDAASKENASYCFPDDAMLVFDVPLWSPACAASVCGFDWLVADVLDDADHKFANASDIGPERQLRCLPMPQFTVDQCHIQARSETGNIQSRVVNCCGNNTGLHIRSSRLVVQHVSNEF
jgi:hypothetical protein